MKFYMHLYAYFAYEILVTSEKMVPLEVRPLSRLVYVELCFTVTLPSFVPDVKANSMKNQVSAEIP